MAGLGLAGLVGCETTPQGRAFFRGLGESMITSAAVTAASEEVKKEMGHRDYRENQKQSYGSISEKFDPWAYVMAREGNLCPEWVKERQGYFNGKTLWSPKGRHSAQMGYNIEMMMRKDSSITPLPKTNESDKEYFERIFGKENIDEPKTTKPNVSDEEKDNNPI